LAHCEYTPQRNHFFMLEVTQAEYQGNFRIWIAFSDGTSGTVDMEDDLWGPVFEPLRDLDTFKRFRVSDVLHTIVWEHDADFAPEFLKGKVERQLMATGG
jgi:hypothetical protein